MAEKKDYLISAAIDFGTTFSGYAFSSLDDYKKDPLKITCPHWVGSPGVYSKTSTCVLFDSNGKFSKFGFEAEEEYSSLALEHEHEQWYYFRRFKMALYGDKKLNRNTEIKDEFGKTMPAIKVFSAGIRYLKNLMIENCKKQLTSVSDTEIRWVLTVPAIWSDSAKQLMRKSAEMAGIPSDQLLIALEPEAASLFCRHIPVAKDPAGAVSAFKAGSKYLVLDAGGGTFDITIHEVEEDGSLREIHRATGGDWGGTKVDDAFGNFLSKIVGSSAYHKFCHEDKYDALDIFRNFEMKKKIIIPDSNDSIYITIPSRLEEQSFSETGKGIMEHVDENEELRGSVNVKKDKLRMKPNIARGLFAEVVRRIVEHLDKLQHHSDAIDLDSILMVGGFSESKMLQKLIKEHFEQLRLIVPNEPGLSVLNGAVIYGHEPRTIKSRICKVTYGIKSNQDFKPDIHFPGKHWVSGDGNPRCREKFDIHVEKGKEVTIGEPQTSRKYTVIHADQTSMVLEVWISHQLHPKYTTDPRCHKLGTLAIEMQDTSRGLNRSIEVQMTFGGTELEVEATDECTGESISASFDFLNDF